MLAPASIPCPADAYQGKLHPVVSLQQCTLSRALYDSGFAASHAYPAEAHAAVSHSVVPLRLQCLEAH